MPLALQSQPLRFRVALTDCFSSLSGSRQQLVVVVSEGHNGLWSRIGGFEDCVAVFRVRIPKTQGACPKDRRA